METRNGQKNVNGSGNGPEPGKPEVNSTNVNINTEPKENSKSIVVPEKIFKLVDKPTIFQIVEVLLKSPKSLAVRLKEGKIIPVFMVLLIIFILSSCAYGLITGSFSGGIQWIAAPVKITAGLLLTSLICLPSLYIFTCLSEVEISPGQIVVLLMAGITLSSVMLIGFGPVTWVFSQSTNALSFMGVLHLLFWGISVIFCMKLIRTCLAFFNLGQGTYLNYWMAIFIITSLQMMTVLRPIIGTSKDILPKKKMFFLEHWGEVVDQESRSKKDELKK